MHYPRELGVLPELRNMILLVTEPEDMDTESRDQFKIIFSKYFCLTITSFPNSVLMSSDCLQHKFPVQAL